MLVEAVNGVKVDFRKLKYVQKMIEIAPDFEEIEQLILFGSVLTEKHTDTSDIDIAVILNKDKDSFRLYDFKGMLWDLDDADNKGINDYVKLDVLAYEKTKIDQSRLIGNGEINIMNTIYRRN